MTKPFFGKALGLAAPLCLALAGSLAAETTVVITTSDNVGGAGTDSNVFVKFYGPEGASKRYRLQNLLSGNILEKGDVDVFTISDNIGRGVTRMELESDGRYSGSDWHLADIKTYTSVQPGLSMLPLLASLPGQSANKDVLKKVVTSTFTYEDWITGDESHPSTIAGNIKRGVSMNRDEPLATLNGPAGSTGTKIFMVMWSDGMDGNKTVPVNLSHTFTRSQSMKLTTGKTNAVTASAEVGVKWQQNEQGKGWTVDARLKSEYAWASSKVDEKSWSTTGSTTSEDKFSAEAGTFEFRILQSNGTVTTQPYKSLMGNGDFAFSYLNDASTFFPRGVTFSKGVSEDAKWNQSVAKPLALSQGEGEYNAMIARLKTFGALSNPVSYAQAMKL